MVRVHNGPADGWAVEDDRDQIWVATLDDGHHLLPARQGPDLEDLLNRAGIGGWQLYRRIDTDPPVYEWVDRLNPR